MNNFIIAPLLMAEEGFIANIRNQIDLNLIQGDRWRLILSGLGVTFQVAIWSLLIGVTLGLLIALMRMSSIAPLRWLANIYLAIIRGVPMPVQLLIWWFVVIAPTGLSRELAAIIAFGINSGAYSAEIYRSGIMSVDKGQTEAGRSVGLSSVQNFIYIVSPQALKNSLPPITNEFITLIKYTSIVGFIGLQDMTRAADLIRSRTFSPLVPYLTIGAIYFTIVMILTIIFGAIERKMRKSDIR